MIACKLIDCDDFYSRSEKGNKVFVMDSEKTFINRRNDCILVEKKNAFIINNFNKNCNKFLSNVVLKIEAKHAFGKMWRHLHHQVLNDVKKF